MKNTTLTLYNKLKPIHTITIEYTGADIKEYRKICEAYANKNNLTFDIISVDDCRMILIPLTDEQTMVMPYNIITQELDECLTIQRDQVIEVVDEI